jgi:serine protease Do
MKKQATLWIKFLILFVLAGGVTARAEGLPDFTGLVEANAAAVVNISTRTKVAAEEADSEDKQTWKRNTPEDKILQDFFRHFFDEQRQQPENQADKYESTSLGSGFIISKDGYVVTNHHVIEDAAEIIVRLNDRRELAGKLIGSDEHSDLALLKIEGNDFPTVELGSSENLKVGSWVLAIGSPFGFDHSVTAGIVSAKGRSLPNGDSNYIPFIQTDVAINPGNSGGPLFNLQGKVVGVNAQIYSRTGGFMGLSFTIPIDVVKDVVNQLKTTGKVVRGWLGVLIQDVDRELAESFGMDKPQGALVAKVLPNSPAEKAQFKTGDIVIKFNDETINHSSDLPPIVGATAVGSTAKALIIRDGKPMTLDVLLEQLPESDDMDNALDGDGSSTFKDKRLGLELENLDKKTREALKIKENGVLVKGVKKGTAAALAGIQVDDVILSLNTKKIINLDEFKKQSESLKAGQVVALLLHRGRSPMFLAIRVPEEQK